MERNDVLFQFFRNCDRRTFLKACGAFAVGAVGGGVLQAVFKVVKTDIGLLSVSQTRLAMGTFVNISVFDGSRERAQEAIGRAFEEIDRLIAILSRHDSSTPLSVLNGEGKLSDAPRELVDVIERSLDFHRLSRGAFDVTVKPVVDLFRQNNGSHPVATPEDIGAALNRVGSDKLEVNRGSVRFAVDGMGMTLDGIAKGYIVDRASSVLSTHGIHNHLINAGGDIRALGRPSARAAWRVAVQDPKKKGNYPEVIHLTNGAVATSGSYEVFFDRERVFHHVVDPRTGLSPRHSDSVSVIADTVMEADALSTSVFVMSPAEGIRLIDSLPRRECLVLGEHGETYRSKGWKSAG
jgi:thiamine biosynthesis lipoprotein